MDDFGLVLSDDFNEAIGRMMGEGTEKPEYDFFNAYLNLFKS
jgi:hypothetical protein